MNAQKAYPRNRLTIWVTGLLLLCLLWSLAGCRRSASYSSVDVKGQYAIWICCDWAEDTNGQVAVRRLSYNKAFKQYVTEQEYDVIIGQDRNNFGLVVDQEGIYEIVLSAPGYETQTQMLNVKDDTVYRVDFHMAVLETSEQATTPEGTPTPDTTPTQTQ